MKPLWLGLLLLASPAFGAVDARAYDAFWLWSGVEPQPVIKQAKTLYILQGQINSTRRAPQRGVQLIAQGMSVPRITQGHVWVVYRAHTLRWPERVYTQVLGLGSHPDQVHVNGDLRSHAFLDGDNATQNFWRGAENFSITPPISARIRRFSARPAPAPACRPAVEHHRPDGLEQQRRPGRYRPTQGRGG